MLSLDDLDNLRAIVSEAPNDPAGAPLHFLEAIVPVVPAMVGGLIVEMLDMLGHSGAATSANDQLHMGIP